MEMLRPPSSDDRKAKAPEKDINEIARLCSDCGSCLAECPVYQVEWTEPQSPRGKVHLIRAVMDGRLPASRRSKKIIDQCLVCGNCETVCPKGVDYVRMMIRYRNAISGGRAIGLKKKIILWFYQSWVFKRVLPLIHLLSRTSLRKHFLLPTPQGKNLKKLVTPDSRPSYDILLFPGCVLGLFYPAKVEKIKSFLENNGYRVAIPPNLACCGFPYLSQGWEKKFQHLKSKNEKIFSRYHFQFLVAGCMTGIYTFRSFYQTLGFPIMELGEFIASQITDPKVQTDFLGGDWPPFTFHDPCHSRNSAKMRDIPRRFLQRFGSQFIDRPLNLCCGFGGIFRIGYPKTAAKIWQQRQEKIRESGAQAVVTSCPGCYLQFRENSDEPVHFLIDLFQINSKPPRPTS